MPRCSMDLQINQPPIAASHSSMSSLSILIGNPQDVDVLNMAHFLS